MFRFWGSILVLHLISLTNNHLPILYSRTSGQRSMQTLVNNPVVETSGLFNIFLALIEEALKNSRLRV